MAGVVGGGLVADVMNQALRSIMWSEMVGDPQEGTYQAQVCLQFYGQCRQQLLRAAHWNFARKEGPMLLLADRTGQTPDVGTIVPGGWVYEYAYPHDALKARFVPLNRNQAIVPQNNIQIPTNIPLVDNVAGAPPFGAGRIQPARFIEDVDANYPVDLGQVNWDTPNISPQGRKVILTNVREAKLVYTMDMLYPSMWDALFRSALVAYLASEIAGPIWVKTDKNFGLRVRGEQEKIVTGKVATARAVDGNEGGPSTSDIRVDWIDGRRVFGTGFGGARGGGFIDGWGGGDGVLGYGFDSLSLPSGAVF